MPAPPDRLVHTIVASPLGRLLLLGDGRALCGLHMQDGLRPVAIEPQWQHASESFREVEAQLEEYFAGQRTAFDLPLAPRGTAFQQSVWSALREIPYGETTTYGALARRLGRPAAARAVGAANGRNPLAVIVPCHRLVGSDGGLTGFAGGLQRKRLLLDLEASRGGTRALAGDSRIQAGRVVPGRA